MIYNKFNTSLIELEKLIEDTDLGPAKKRELFTDIIDYIENVPFLNSLVDKDIPRAKDLPKDSTGRIIIDLTKPHQLEDMDYFRQTLRFFQKHGEYTKLYPNRSKTSAYRQFWVQEKDRILNGMVRESDGEWIPGSLYFYWNYVPIKLVNVVKGRKAERIMGHPHSFLGDYLWYHYKNKARDLGKHCELLKCRGAGFSFKNGADGARNAVLIKNSNTFYFASKNEYIDPDKDGVLLKTWDSLDYLAIHTPFPKLRIKNTLNEKTIGYLDKRTGTIKGNKSLVMGASTKDDPDKPRGKRGDIIFEEYGSYPNIRDTWNACRDSVESGGFAFAQMTAGGTSSIKDSNFHGAEEMFYYPKPYNILGVSNVFEKNSTGEQEVGFFWGAYMNREQCYDKDGNPDIVKALFELCLERIEIKYSASDPSTLSTRKAEKPITPKEACLQTTGSIFPVGEITDYLTNINLNRDKFISNSKVGDLIIDDNNIIKFKENSNLIPIRSYNKEGANRKGALEIFNLPVDTTNKDRYILGSDPIDSDYIKDGSLASIFVFDMLKDDIVAEYTGRPKLAEEYYELCYKLALFYNGKINYENNLKGMFSYFDKINKTNILMDTPSILKDIEVIKSTGIGNRSKGTPANKQVNAYGRKLLADWMMKERIITEDNEPKTILNLFSIKSIGLLEEASKWNEDGNFDRISAMGMVMIAREEYLKNTNFKNSIKQNRKVFESKFLKKFGSHR